MVDQTKPKSYTQVVMTTSEGPITLELFEDKAPETVENFLKYIVDGHYNGTIFHRVIDGFMIQGGGFTTNMEQKPTRKPIKNEAANRLSNKRGTIAMARTSDVNSATAQFFINVADNTFLNFVSEAPSQYGYCVFGQVIEGMDIVDKIKSVKTHTVGHHSDVPVSPIEILKVERISPN